MQDLPSVLIVKAVVAAFNQEKALVGAFSVITNLRMELFEALVDYPGTLETGTTFHLTYSTHNLILVNTQSMYFVQY